MTRQTLFFAVIWSSLALGCRRDPVLLGFWDILALEVGAPGEPSDRIADVGTVEFSTESVAVFMLRCAWDGEGLVASPPTGPWTVDSDAGPAQGLFDAYATRDERFFVTLGDFRYSIDDWTVSGAVLRSDAALPPPEWTLDEMDSGAVGDFSVVWTLAR